jgi:uncharacterized protein YvpB
MKTKLSLVWSLLLLIIIINSCKKSATISQNIQKTVQIHYGTGAILDSAEFAKVPKLNLDEIKAKMITDGFLSKLVLNGPPPTSMILNHPDIGYQGNDGTCVSWAEGYALMGTLNNEFPTEGVGNPRSPYYVYQKDHSVKGDCSTTNGMSPTDGMNILQSFGVPSQSYDNSLGAPCDAPANTVNADAALNNVFRFGSISSVTEVKQAISMHLPVLLAFNVYTSFDDAFGNHTTYTSVTGTYRARHAVCIIGYDDSKNAVLVQNSWGTFGGDLTYPGCVWIDYGLLTNGTLQIQMLVATPNSSVKQPVFEFYNSSVGKHANSLNYTLTNQAAGYNYNGQPFSAYARNFSGGVPIYQFLNSSTQDHVLTTVANHPEWPAYTYNGIVFFAYSTQVAGTIPVYEYFNNDHYYSTSASKPSPSWIANGVAFYVLPN